MNRTRTDHVVDLLPAYVNGTLDRAVTARIEAHLIACATCREERAEWEAIAGATARIAQTVPAPADALLNHIWDEIDRVDAPRQTVRITPRLHWLWQLLVGQLPLVRRGIWTASALTMALGCLIELLRPYGVGKALATLAPVVAAMGVAFVYGPETDPSLEIARATPTSPRLVLLARLTLVYAYDILLAVLASAFITAVRGEVALWPVIVLWLGPMLFLSALSLVLSLLCGSTVGISVALALWGTQVLAASRLWIPGGMRADWIARFWSNNALLLPLAAALLVVAVLAVPWQQRLPQGNQAERMAV